jgi:hypothetical protein
MGAAEARVDLPFTIDQFLDVFARMNGAIWPAQLGAHLLGAAALVLALRGGAAAVRAVPALLAGAWAFVGVVYHLLFFAPINPAAWLFGAAFLFQAVLFSEAAARRRLTFGWAASPRGWVGLAVVAYAAVIYPALGAALGHAWPRAPVFGVAPCPTTIFTFGVLLLARGPVPRRLLVVPLLWALLGASAALHLNVREDLGLVVAGVLATALLVFGRGAPPSYGTAAYRRRTSM